MTKILIVKRDKLGDMLLTTPMLAWLRAALPHAELHVLANDYNAWVLNGDHNVDHVWCTPRLRHDGKLRLGLIWSSLLHRREIVRQRFDWVLIGNGEESPRAIKLGLAAKGMQTVAYCKEAHRWPGLSHPLLPPQGGHESRRIAATACAMGLDLPTELPAPTYVLPNKSRQSSLAWLSERNIAPDSFVIVGLGARKQKKKPSVQQVARWANYFSVALGKKTILLWTPGSQNSKLYPGDDELAHQILVETGATIVPFQGALDQTIGMIWHASTSIIPDSGLMHFAAASPGGVLGLFANRSISPSPEQWGPIGPRALHLEAGSAVAEIDDALIFGAVKRLLQGDTITEFHVSGLPEY